LAYSTGQGVSIDSVAAHKWFNLAASRGLSEAKVWRNDLTGEMNPSQIAEAQKLAREWQTQVG
jgi:TPR repeat protein